MRHEVIYKCFVVVAVADENFVHVAIMKKHLTIASKTFILFSELPHFRTVTVWWLSQIRLG